MTCGGIIEGEKTGGGGGNDGGGITEIVIHGLCSCSEYLVLFRRHSNSLVTHFATALED